MNPCCFSTHGAKVCANDACFARCDCDRCSITELCDILEELTLASFSVIVMIFQSESFYTPW